MEMVRELVSREGRSRSGRKAKFGYGFALAQNPAWSLAQVLLATGGRLWGDRTRAFFRLICSDSRLLEAGDLFIALRGDNFDGHDFIEDALRKGAAGLVLDTPPVRPVLAPVVLVPDTLRALGDLAHYRRRLLPKLKVLAITGSSGKTTVKEMSAAILERKQRVLKTRGNLNNLIGLPLSLLPAEEHHRIAVMEMGMNRPGEIARMTEIARPDLALINNIQEAHLAGLVDLNGVARAKGELFQNMLPWTTLVVNLDDRKVRAMAAKLPHARVTFGRSAKAMVRATQPRSRGEEGMSFTLSMPGWRGRIKLGALGAHNVQNALAAAALAHAAGASGEDIAAGLEAYRSFSKRLSLQPFIGGLKLVDDCYNANPASMLAALETVHNLRRNRKVVAVLGDMLELGAHGVAAHRFIGEKVAKLEFDYLLTVGEFAREMAGAARKGGMSSEKIKACDGKEEIAAWLAEAVKRGTLGPDDLVLLKASRGMKMETIIDGLSHRNRLSASTKC